MLEVGMKAPEFILPDKNGNEVSLSDFLGKKVLTKWGTYDILVKHFALHRLFVLRKALKCLKKILI